MSSLGPEHQAALFDRQENIITLNTEHPRGQQRDKLARFAAENNLGAVVLCSYQAVSYFARTQIMTQISIPDRLAFFVVGSDGASALLVCSLETRLVRGQSDVADIRDYTEFADVPAEVLGDLLDEMGVDTSRIGVEGRRLPTADARLLRKRFEGVELVEIDDSIEKMQAVKERHEVASLALAGRATRESVLEAAAKAPAGVTERELSAGIMHGMMLRGGIPTFIVFGSGVRGLETHAEPTNKRLVEGEIWRMDAGARFDGVFNSDLARTGVVGEPSAEQDEILQALRATQNAGFAACEPGRPASDVFQAVKAEFERQRLPFFMPHIGHGHGIGLHEAPMLQPANHMPLAEGMVLCIEPMVQLPDRNECYHVEDLVEVTDEGCRNLTEPQDELVRIAAE